MTLSGGILLIISWGVIIALNVFCLVKVFGKRDNEPEDNSNNSGKSGKTATD